MTHDRVDVVLLERQVRGDCKTCVNTATRRSGGLTMGLTIVDLDGAINVERNFEVLERIQDRVVDVKLLPTRTPCE